MRTATPKRTAALSTAPVAQALSAQDSQAQHQAPQLPGALAAGPLSLLPEEIQDAAANAGQSSRLVCAHDRLF